eukprot:1158006-Pelagomonas_calceolata.AAC.17
MLNASWRSGWVCLRTQITLSLNAELECKRMQTILALIAECDLAQRVDMEVFAEKATKFDGDQDWSRSSVDV